MDPGADPRAVSDDGKRPDRDAGAERHVPTDDGCRVNARRRAPVVGEELDRARKCQVRMARPEHRARRNVGRLAKDDRRGAGRAQGRGVLGVGEERQLARDRVVNPRDAADVDVGVALEAAVEPRRDVLEFQGVGEYLIAGSRSRFAVRSSRLPN